MPEPFNERVGIVGTGNVAWHLTRLFQQAGVRVSGVLVRNEEKAKRSSVGGRFAVSLTDDLASLASSSDLMMIAVNDSSIADIAANLTGYEGVVCHTSGSCHINMVSKYVASAGVFYPLQTLSAGHQLPPDQIPICIEGVDEAVEQLLKRLAATAGFPCYPVNSDERTLLHVAAVFACNFTNHLLAIAHNIGMQNSLDTKLMHPLIKETIRKAMTGNPADMQTGPAVRNDMVTIKKHLKLLRNQPRLEMLYEMLTNSIIESETNKINGKL